MHTLYVLHLDPYQIGDPLFLQNLAQAFHKAKTGARDCLIVHGSGEKLERTLEAEGVFAEFEHGVLQVETDEQRRLAERAVRETNQDLVGTLTDEVVPTVGIQGVDRGLLSRTDDGEIHVGSVGWLEALVKQHVVGVVSALVDDAATGSVREVWTPDAGLALMGALDDVFDPVVVVFTTSGRPGLTDATGTPETASPDAVSDDDVANPDAVRRYVDGGRPVLVTSPDAFFADDGPSGTRISSDA